MGARVASWLGDGNLNEGSRYPTEIRPAGQSDIDGLLVVERQCFNVHYYAYYMLGRRDFEHYLENSSCTFLVAVLDTEIVGYVLGPVEPWRVPAAAHIDSIAVLPEAQYKTIGTHLLHSFMQQAQRQGCKLITLEVAIANDTGLAFFARHGFQPLRPLRNYYGQGLHAQFMAASIERPEPWDLPADP